MVQGEQTPQAEGAVLPPECQVAWLLQLLRRSWKLHQLEPVLQPCHVDVVATAQSTQPAEELQLERLQRTPGAIPDRTTEDRAKARDEYNTFGGSGCCGRVSLKSPVR